MLWAWPAPARPTTVTLAGVLQATGKRSLGSSRRGPGSRRRVAVILGGPALFLLGRATFEYQVFSRISLSRPGGLLALLAIAPGVIFLPPVFTELGAALVLAGVAITDTRRSWGRPPEAPLPPH
ncbi:low temperature requirement protein A [Micromonospora sp. NPDC005171]|uniref:low temperature requirement protein A n=1 Tax=Micromonospora sp. NPDC005171 TaxID=3156866 RepID=UPI0033AB25CF